MKHPMKSDTFSLKTIILITVFAYFLFFGIAICSQIEVDGLALNNSSINDPNISSSVEIGYKSSSQIINQLNKNNITIPNSIYINKNSEPLFSPPNNEINEKEEVFFEEHPAWNTPDLAVIKLDAQPDRLYPGNISVITASIANIGVGRSEASNFSFSVDDSIIGVGQIRSLAAGEQANLRTRWRAQRPGIHQVAVQIEPGGDHFDGTVLNNFKVIEIWVFGEDKPQPEVSMDLKLDSIQLNAGESHNLTLIMRNPSFVDIKDETVGVYIDGRALFRGSIDHLKGGESQNRTFSWNVTPGQHIIEARLTKSQGLSNARNGLDKSWYVTVPGRSNIDGNYPTNWVSIGPGIITGASGLPSGSVGRIDSIAFHPTDSNILYAGSPYGGLWKTTDGGKSWSPLTDKLPVVGVVFAVAVDPRYPDIVYFANSMGIFKSLDGGKSWNLFATQALSTGPTDSLPISGSRKLVIRYLTPESNSFVIYAATDIGVLRYESHNPWSIKSTASQWRIIKSGKIFSMTVNPKDSSEIYVSVIQDTIYKTNNGLSAANDNDWKKLADPYSTGFPQAVASSYYTIDVYWDKPNVIYVAIATIDNVLNLGISRSEDDGNTWHNLIYHKGLLPGPYNPFIRVSPKNKDLIYFSGIKLYKLRWNWGGSLSPCVVAGIHDDMHGFEWDPLNPSSYYVGCDGGLWRCTSEDQELSCDTCEPINNDLRVATFYDFDSSKSNPKLMIGGTQDCGTILYQGSPDWKSIAGGDGLYSLIAPGDQVLYSQYQQLNSTKRSDKGAATGWGDWASANNGLPGGFAMEDSWIVLHPNDPSGNYLLSQGDQVYRTLDGGKFWEPIGPKGQNVKGIITRVVVQPQTFTILAGTSGGQIWYYRGGGWSLADENKGARVTSMAFAPTDYRILYVAYDSPDPYWRVARLVMQADGSWQSYPITDNLPAKYLPLNVDVKVTSIAGDGYNSSVAYVGTIDPTGLICGTVFRGETSCDGCAWKWKNYDQGLPNVPVKDLLVDPSSKELRAATYGRSAWSIVTGYSQPGFESGLTLACLLVLACLCNWTRRKDH